MGRHEKRVAQAHHRASVARFRREAEGTLRTYLVAPDDAELDSIPILKRATRSWLDNLKSKSGPALFAQAGFQISTALAPCCYRRRTSRSRKPSPFPESV